jgi:hypothetical protein
MEQKETETTESVFSVSSVCFCSKIIRNHFQKPKLILNRFLCFAGRGWRRPGFDHGNRRFIKDVGNELFGIYIL